MSVIAVVSTILVISILLAVRRIVRLAAERAKLRRTIPQLQGGGIFGWFPDFFRPDKHRVVAAWSRKFDGIFFYRMLAHHVSRMSALACHACAVVAMTAPDCWRVVQQGVIVTDPHIASEVLLNRPGIQKSDVVKALDLVLSGSGHSSLLTASTNAHWQAVRKAVAPAFSTANIRSCLKASCYCFRRP